jgi:hypothetical protein
VSVLLGLLWLVVLVGGVFLLLPHLTSSVSGLRLSRRHNVTVGRLVGLVISITSIILLYQTFT